MSHIANKTTAELTCPNPYACFPKHNILGTYSLNCLWRFWNRTKPPHKKTPSILAITSSSMLERWVPVLAAASITGLYWHQGIKTCETVFRQCWEGGIICLIVVPRDSNQDQIPAAHSTKVAIGNCPSCPGGLLTFQRRGKGWIIFSNNSHLTWELTSAHWCGPCLLPNAVDCNGNSGVMPFVQNWIKCKRVIPDTSSSCLRLHSCDRTQSYQFPHLHMSQPLSTFLCLFFCQKKNGIAHAMLHLHCYFCFQVP